MMQYSVLFLEIITFIRQRVAVTKELQYCACLMYVAWVKLFQFCVMYFRNRKGRTSTQNIGTADIPSRHLHVLFSPELVLFLMASSAWKIDLLILGCLLSHVFMKSYFHTQIHSLTKLALLASHHYVLSYIESCWQVIILKYCIMQ